MTDKFQADCPLCGETVTFDFSEASIIKHDLISLGVCQECQLIVSVQNNGDGSFDVSVDANETKQQVVDGSAVAVPGNRCVDCCFVASTICNAKSCAADDRVDGIDHYWVNKNPIN